MDKRLYRYCDFLFVFCGTIDELKARNQLDASALDNQVWYAVCRSTRHVLAHACMYETTNLVRTVLDNVVCLLKLFGIDLRFKAAFGGIRGSAVMYADGRIDFNDPRLPNELTYEQLQADFDRARADPILRRFIFLLGRIVHHLVATRDSGWSRHTASFATFDVFAEIGPDLAPDAWARIRAAD